MVNKVTIVGLGNSLMKDDGIGPRVVKELHRDGLPPGVQAVEWYGSFFQYWDLLARCKYVIAVDALQACDTPGSVYLLTPGDIDLESEGGPFRHENCFLSELDLMARFGVRPEVFILGVEPKEIAYSLELSPEISGRMPFIVRAVRELYTPLLNSVPEIATGATSEKLAVRSLVGGRLRH